jgi:Family of unknown function (DUF6491)
MRQAMLVPAAAAALVAAWAAQAIAQPKPQSSRPPQQDSCLNTRFVNGFSAPDEQTVYVRVGVRDIYRLKLFSSCLNVDWTQSVALRSRSGGSFICHGFDAELIVPNRGMGPQRCQVSDIHKLTPEEIAALPKKDRP